MTFLSAITTNITRYYKKIIFFRRSLSKCLITIFRITVWKKVEKQSSNLRTDAMSNTVEL